MFSSDNDKYKWVVFSFATAIWIVIAIQMMAMPVLFPIISSELDLNLAQLGFIWGLWTLGGVIFSIPGGLLADRIGINIATFMVVTFIAVFCGLRGIANDATFLAITMFLGGGLLGSFLSIAPKVLFMWFPAIQLGLSNGLFWGLGTVGRAIGTSISASILTPALGSWRNVIFLYAGILFIMAVLWLIFAREPKQKTTLLRVPFAEAFIKSITNKYVWLWTIASLGSIGLFTMFMGYLPTYLHEIGWSINESSFALTVTMLVSIITAITIPAVSDRFGFRRLFYIMATIISIISVASISIAQNNFFIWLIMIIIGLSVGATPPLLTAIIPEIKGVGIKYTATAIGIIMGFNGFGGWMLSTLGGNLAMIQPQMPFIICPVIALILQIALFFTKEK